MSSGHFSVTNMFYLSESNPAGEKSPYDHKHHNMLLVETRAYGMVGKHRRTESSQRPTHNHCRTAISIKQTFKGIVTSRFVLSIRHRKAVLFKSVVEPFSRIKGFCTWVSHVLLFCGNVSLWYLLVRNIFP